MAGLLTTAPNPDRTKTEASSTACTSIRAIRSTGWTTTRPSWRSLGARPPDAPARRLPPALHGGLSLDASYDAIVCLFSSIGYLPDADALRRTMHTFSDHLAPGGVIVVEPWLSAQQLGAFQSSQLVCADGLEIARIARHRVDGDKLTLWHYLAGGPDDVRYFVEEHRMSLFSNEDYRDAFEHAECVFDPVVGRHAAGSMCAASGTAHERRRDGLARRNGSQRLGRLFPPAAPVSQPGTGRVL